MLTYSSGEAIAATLKLVGDGGLLELSFQDGSNHSCSCQSHGVMADCNGTQSVPETGQRVRVLYRPLGATYFASRYAWGRRAAYASHFLDPIGRAWRTKAKVKAALLGDEDPDEWDLPPKPKGMRWATYERWVAKYDAAEEMLDAQLVMAAARLMKRL